jgi:heme-degrading monooxygenase HmoA
MNPHILTVVTATIDPDRGDELLAGFQKLAAAPIPDGLLRTQLLQGANSEWIIQSLWRDRDALDNMRAASEPPAAPRLFHSVGADPSLQIFEIMIEHDFSKG